MDLSKINTRCFDRVFSSWGSSSLQRPCCKKTLPLPTGASTAIARMPPVDLVDVNFGVGTLAVQSDDAVNSGIFILHLTLHKMPFDDVMLLLVFFVPLVLGLLEASSRAMLWWDWLEEKALAVRNSIRESYGEQLDSELSEEGALANAHSITPYVSHSAISSGPRLEPAPQLPPPSCFSSLMAWLQRLSEFLPIQLRPYVLRARARSVYQAVQVTGVRPCLISFLSDLVCFKPCMDICVQSRQRGRRFSAARRRLSEDISA